MVKYRLEYKPSNKYRIGSKDFHNGRMLGNELACSAPISLLVLKNLLLEHVCMRPEVNSNWFEISIWCKVTSLSALT